MPREVRALTAGEAALAATVFGDAIDYGAVRMVRGKWAFFQPRETVMAPCGHIHFHPRGHTWSEDFAAADLSAQGLFVHEMTHVWQTQTRGRWYLPTRRHPFCRYDYAIRPGQPLRSYGIEQQAEIVRHTFLLRRGSRVIGAPDRAVYETILPFGTAPR
ncbi:vgr related protein [Sphingomonas immobilis]|uniref:Vgr related protein n=1 Tax=Sphingomonas immobilis TaxID=3063997 RepID=A0ABT8ZYF5_9SPHN|nr:vgr related protein [Sphingomonas sp. CA1-15]MDO7842608.1 vgr related protein [Sphingomonas sp. CA1-15]